MRHKFFNRRVTRGIAGAVSLLVLLAVGAPTVYAANCSTDPDLQTCSSSYGVSESFFGSGGVDTCPTIGTNEYCAKQSAGELTVGNTKGTLYQAQAGFNTDRMPYIEMNISKYVVNLGTVTTTTTGFDTATFAVKAYLSDGYVVQIYGTPPKNGSHQITPLATPTASSIGSEQFGINLVQNATPALGADPSQDPDATFAFGTAAAGYNTADSYKYVSGDTIASSTKSSSFTDYTISYIMNITAVTPGGVYTTGQSLVATGTY